jgi:hypothetical protein
MLQASNKGPARSPGCNELPGQAPRLEGVDAYRNFMGPFVQMLKGSELVAAFGDEEKAVVIYDTETVLVHSAPGAECVTVKDGKVTQSLFIFDPAPFDAAREAQAAAAP